MTSKTELSVDDRLAEAAEWHADMECGTGDQAAFEAWRDSDPRNAAAFARMLGLAAEVSRVKPGLGYLLQSGPDRRMFIQAAVASIGAVALGLGTFALMRGGRASAHTNVGELRQVGLPDGGHLSVNTDSQVEWKFDSKQRAIWLKKGEIALSMPADPRPMCLYAGNKLVLFDGGKVNARLRDGALDLLVLQGAVRVREAASSAGGAVTVQQGEAVLAGSTVSRTRAMTPADIQFVSAWQSGQVYFNGVTLGAAIEEYNRYLTQKISIGDPSIQGIRLGGRFNSHDPADFLASLHDGFGIVATHTADGAVVLTK